MKDLLKTSRVVEARLRELEYEMQEEAADTISALCTTLEAEKAEVSELRQQREKLCDRIDADKREWSRFHHVMKKHGLHPGRTDDNLIDILDSALEAAKKDAERLDYVQANSGYTLRKYKRHWSFKPFTNYEYEVFDTVREAIDAAIKAQGDANETA